MIYYYICDYYIYICGLAWMSWWSVASMDFLPSSDGHWVFFCCRKSAARELIPKIHKVHLNNEKKQWFPVIPGSKNQWCAFLWTSTTPKSQVHQCSSMFLLKSVYWLVVLNRARNAAEVWKFFHNGYADKAAKTANQARSEAFWQFWEEHVQATERARRLAQQVTALQLAIGKRHVRAQNDITDVIEQGPRVTREFVPCFAFGNWTGQMVPNAARLFGTAHVTRAMRWLEARLVTDDTAEPQWLSFTQLYLDYQMTWSNPGPLRVQQQWVDLSSRPYLTVATIPFRTRVRWFRQFLKAIWKEGGLQATMDQCRPASQMIQAYVPCVALPWAKHAVQIVDSWLGQELTAPCTRAAGALKALPVPKQCPELRLLDP